MRLSTKRKNDRTKTKIEPKRDESERGRERERGFELNHGIRGVLRASAKFP
jgi:hypothetical protein